MENNYIIVEYNGTAHMRILKKTKEFLEAFKPKCYCPDCDKADCIHRNAYRRMPEVDGGLGLCPNLKGDD